MLHFKLKKLGTNDSHFIKPSKLEGWVDVGASKMGMSEKGIKLYR